MSLGPGDGRATTIGRHSAVKAARGGCPRSDLNEFAFLAKIKLGKIYRSKSRYRRVNIIVQWHCTEIRLKVHC